MSDDLNFFVVLFVLIGAYVVTYGIIKLVVHQTSFVYEEGLFDD